MKVLHLFSNWKFTGPADPALILATKMDFKLRKEGVGSVTWAAGHAPVESGVQELGAERGLQTISGLRLQKHQRPVSWLHDLRKLRRWFVEGRFDLAHTHLANDHHLAATAAHGTSVAVVRSYYDLEPPRTRRGRTALKKSQALLAPSEMAAEALRNHFPSFGNRVELVPPPLDFTRFQVTRQRDLLQRWGIEENAFVGGVVARMQTHRRFPELIEGFAKVARHDPGLHLVVLGRGTRQEQVAKKPATQSGVSEQIHFPGYIEPAEYPAILPNFDALIFLVPGSDGTCRAVREAQACGVPLITSSRGLLPELMAPGESGLLLSDDAPDQLAEAIPSLRADPPRRAALARGAIAYARERFDPEVISDHVVEIYRKALRRVQA